MTIKKLSDDRERVRKLYAFENELYAQGYDLIAGVDEAGRGSLVGPMTVAAVILPKNLYLPKLNDSKKISAHIREILYEEIISEAVDYSVVKVSVEEIDEFNIYQATLHGMKRAVESLDRVPEFILTDAMNLNLENSRSIIHGDALSASIAAASIIAKVTRDRMTDKWHEKYPAYGFNHNRGYGTKSHIEAIKTVGPCPLHRKSFNPVKSMLGGI